MAAYFIEDPRFVDLSPVLGSRLQRLGIAASRVHALG